MSCVVVISCYRDPSGKKVYFRSHCRYWTVPVLVNTGTFLVYQYYPKMLYLPFLERVSSIQKLTLLERKMVQYCPILVYQYLGLEVHIFLDFYALMSTILCIKSILHVFHAVYLSKPQNVNQDFLTFCNISTFTSETDIKLQHCVNMYKPLITL